MTTNPPPRPNLDERCPAPCRTSRDRARCGNAASVIDRGLASRPAIPTAYALQRPGWSPYWPADGQTGRDARRRSFRLGMRRDIRCSGRPSNVCASIHRRVCEGREGLWVDVKVRFDPGFRLTSAMMLDLPPFLFHRKSY